MNACETDEILSKQRRWYQKSEEIALPEYLTARGISERLRVCLRVSHERENRCLTDVGSIEEEMRYRGVGGGDGEIAAVHGPIPMGYTSTDSCL